jgi:hypothetical protein
MRSLPCKTITYQAAFKAIPYSRRAQLWNRQASIITDLTMLAFRHGWRCLSMSDPCACDTLRSSVAWEV